MVDLLTQLLFWGAGAAAVITMTQGLRARF